MFNIQSFNNNSHYSKLTTNEKINIWNKKNIHFGFSEERNLTKDTKLIKVGNHYITEQRDKDMLTWNEEEKKKEEHLNNIKKHGFSYLFHKYLLNIANPNNKINYKIIKNNITNEFKEKKYYAHLHCFNISQFNEIYGKYINKISKYFSLVITYSIGENTINNSDFVLLKIPNKGMDIGAKFCAVAYLNYNKISYEYIIFLHSKSDPKIRKKYFEVLINNLSEEFIENINQNDGYFPDLEWEIVGNTLKMISGNPQFTNINLPERNVLYRNELLKYLAPNNNSNRFIEGNCYILSKKVIDKLYIDPKIYNILNTDTSFDYNWISKAYNIQGNILEVYKQFLQRKLAPRNKYSYDGYLENVFERVILNFCDNYKILKETKNNEINLIGLKNINVSIADNLVLLKNYLNILNKNIKINLYDISEIKKINYNIKTIFCIQPFEIINLIPYLSKFRNKPEVLWVWEFKSLPQIFKDYEKYFSKVYVPSQFCYDIFSKHLSIPIEKVKLKSMIHDYIDKIPDHKIKNQKVNNILETTKNKTIYGFCFDLNSSIVRKNPFNLVRAFNNLNDETKVLILKYRPIRGNKFINKIEYDIYNSFIIEVKKNKNIYCITDELEQLDLYKLYSIFDSYISPHCGEGFGLTIYDNMILGNKIISPYYSGETEYLNRENIIRLEYEEKEIPGLKEHPIYGQMKDFKGAYISVESIMKGLNAHFLNNLEIINFKNSNKKLINNNKILIISLYDEKKIFRRNELIQVLKININNHFLNKIAVLYERKIGFFDEILKHPKVDIYIANKRPTYNSYFEICNKYYIDKICLVSNSDIIFNDSVNIINITNNMSIYCLTRYNIINLEEDKNSYKIRYHYMNNNASQDVWIFKSPIKLLKTDLIIGTFTCDSFINAQFINLDYNYINISNKVKCFHLQSEISDSQINNNLNNSISVNNNEIIDRNDFFNNYLNNIRKYNQRLSVVGIDFNGNYFYPTGNNNCKFKFLTNDCKLNKILHCSGCNDCNWEKFFPNYLYQADLEFAEANPLIIELDYDYYKGIESKKFNIKFIYKILDNNKNLINFTIENNSLIFSNTIKSDKFYIYYKDIMFIEVKKENFIKYNNYGIIISGITKNTGPYIKKLKSNINYIKLFFKNVKIFIYENDSTDNTKNLLKEYFNENEILCENNITNKKYKFHYSIMAIARNKCREFINKQDDINYPYVLLIDTDINIDLNMKNIQSALNNREKFDVQFANGVYLNKYYWDTFATRTKEKNIPFYYHLDSDGINKYWKIVTNIPDAQKPIENEFTEVISAFGGMGLYKKYCFKLSRYDPNIEDCEHVPFHENLFKMGKKLVINRDFIKNYSNEETKGAYYHLLK
tara:strand:+ start:1160 stop:5227 length:4068 start_codon:yes stop_codon:yes gene_type:complete